MRASWDVVRDNPALLWFPLVSTVCLVLVTLFWIFEGAWLYAVSGPWSCSCRWCCSASTRSLRRDLLQRRARRRRGRRAGGTAAVVRGGRLARLVALRADRRLGRVVAHRSLAIARRELQRPEVGRAGGAGRLELRHLLRDPVDRRRGHPGRRGAAESMSLARAAWQEETGGLGALRLALLVPGLLFYLDTRLLFRATPIRPRQKNDARARPALRVRALDGRQRDPAGVRGLALPPRAGGRLDDARRLTTELPGAAP